MISVAFTPVHVILLLPVIHFTNTILLAWMPHFLLHQQILGIPLYKIHLYSHHKPNHFSVQKRSFLACFEHFLWLGLISIFFALYSVFFAQWIALLLIIEGLLGVVAIYYLHLEYENPRSWLQNYTWFHRSRKLHQLHHQYSRENHFSKSKNYSFGGFGLRGHWADCLMGTFQSSKME